MKKALAFCMMAIVAIPARGQVALPCHGTASNANPLWWMTQKGLGNAGRFEITAASNTKGALVGTTQGTGCGVFGLTYRGSEGVHGESRKTDGRGVVGIATSGGGAHGVHGESQSGWGVYAKQVGTGNWAGLGGTNDGIRAEALNSAGNGVVGLASNGADAWGVLGYSDHGVGVRGNTTDGTGVHGHAADPAGYAGRFDGQVGVTGYLHKAGGGFKIDHPLDPQGKYLNHSFVESPDMKNVYDGVVTLDSAGTAWVLLPDWFEALNRDFRYQLTCIGGFAPVYIAQEVSGNGFRIAGGRPGMKVSWQVTGIRRDAWADANRTIVEEDKPENERGYYQNPEAFGLPAEMSIASLKGPSGKRR